MKYVWKDGAWRDPDGNAMEVPDRIAMPRVQSDTPDYFSVASNKWISGARQRRDDLARTGCRPVEPDEAPPRVCRTKKWAERLKMDWDPTVGTPKHRLSTKT